MDAIALPDSTVWPTPTLGVAIVHGDPIAIPPTLHALAMETPLDQHTVPLFVAPRQWAQYDKPCETCGDTDDPGDVICPSTGCLTRCDDCVGTGRQEWTVRWPCPTYGETHIGYSQPSDSDGRKRSRKRGGGTGACENDPPCERGLLSALATIQVVPVVERGVHPESRTFIVVAQGVAMLVVDGHYTELPLDPLPTPGQFAVIVKVVE